jgi:hypothetical protein
VSYVRWSTRVHEQCDEWLCPLTWWPEFKIAPVRVRGTETFEPGEPLQRGVVLPPAEGLALLVASGALEARDGPEAVPVYPVPRGADSATGAHGGADEGA